MMKRRILFQGSFYVFYARRTPEIKNSSVFESIIQLFLMRFTTIDTIGKKSYHL
ncbi:MAG: hypothetical protein BSOLF_1544 [Candidatus Carbobacillus altaicus]|uniref:Uncharacterized protein n=1 Tax=Candidatus Carbonibacillus altaicus TaxID=2163959 RepID=A0A2R6XZ86_9BACL|nr:MAG: hypothetical protein BSOLF_1544 [Candidatus Carbobacillus altaicus]